MTCINAWNHLDAAERGFVIEHQLWDITVKEMRSMRVFAHSLPRVVKRPVTYDPKDVKLTIGGVEIVGHADGSFIEVERDDKFEPVNTSGRGTGSITFTLLSSEPHLPAVGFDSNAFNCRSWIFPQALDEHEGDLVDRREHRAQAFRLRAKLTKERKRAAR